MKALILLLLLMLLLLMLCLGKTAVFANRLAVAGEKAWRWGRRLWRCDGPS
jgi:hypothetical protein